MHQPDDDDQQSSELPHNATSSKTSPTEPRTLLPSPLASIISAATACSSLSLRIGGFFGRAAIKSARVGTLSGFELGRVVLEGILTRAGQNIVDSSTGALGVTAAERILERALSSLHYLITHTSFLISAGFEVGSTSVSSSIAVAEYFLSALNAIFGDTETSKAIATIIVLVQREFSNPETGINGERVGLADLWAGAIGFGLLQRWGQDKTDEDIQDRGGEVVVWNIVVVNDVQPVLPELSLQSTEQEVDDVTVQHTPVSNRPTSFVSAAGDELPFDTFANDDGISFVSASSRPTSAGNDLSRSEQAFKQYLVSQVKPGTKVQITAQSVTTNSVTVEILGDSNIDVHPPQGYSLITEHSSNPLDKTLVFQNRRKRFRRGSFEIESSSKAPGSLDLLPDHEDYLEMDRSPTPAENAVSADSTMSDIDNKQMENQSSDPIVANEKRTRAPLANHQALQPISVSALDGLEHATPPKLQKRSFKSPLRRGSTYKNLVDFWKDRDKSTDQSTHLEETKENVDNETHVEMANTESISYDRFARPRPKSRPSIQRSTSLRKHQRGASSTCTITSTTSETSLVLRDGLDDPSEERVVSNLQRDGILQEMYPRGLFVDNISRFARFALASYGSRFLRLTGSVADVDQTQLTQTPTDHVAAHHSFTTYTRLPDSTVLLSSFVDPQGGSNAAGETETGMPLVHYISLDHETKSVVFTCRGTLGFEDVLTDMTCDYDDLNWRGRTYQVHKGVLASARRLLTLHSGRIIATIAASLEEYEDYGLVLCGHSLGGSVTAVLAILLSQPNTTSSGGSSAYVTSAIPTQRLLQASVPGSRLSTTDSPPIRAIALPPNRPIHVYAYGPAACVSALLQQATRGLVTTIIHGQDCVPYLSLGTLRDHQAVSLAFKTDTKDAKGELRRRVWEGIRKSLSDKTGFSEAFRQDWWTEREEEDDQWPWAALKSLRAAMTAQKLLPPGEVFTITSRPVLQRHAFVNTTNVGAHDADIGASYKPATHVKMTHVRDVAARFGELRLGASMFTDHIPARYERALGVLQRGTST